VPIVIGAGAAVGGKLLIQERTIGESISDKTIWTKIKAAFADAKVPSPGNDVTVTVHEGKVLLVGAVKTKEEVVKILKAAWGPGGVKEVINEIEVAERHDDSLAKYAKDSWITTKIKTKLLSADNVRSANYNIETVKQVVYVFGIAYDEPEKELVLDIISKVKGVNEVKSYIRLKHKETASTTDEIDDYNALPEPVELVAKPADVSSSLTKEREVGDVVDSKTYSSKPLKKSVSIKKSSKSSIKNNKQIFDESDLD
jgi:osmotically-inducible protein OsmY